MKFTYHAYGQLIELLRENDYTISSYHDYDAHGKCVILRHDIDVCLERAMKFATFEREQNVVSTYFILLSSNHYNISSRTNHRIIHELAGMGHEIGLHFDETKYRGVEMEGGGHIRKSHAGMNRADDRARLMYEVERERRIMSDILDMNISAVSMHRPSEDSLTAEWQFKNAVNSYSKTFYRDFKYLSDSRRNWREPILDIVKSNRHKRLHILTHPFWYSEDEVTASEAIRSHIGTARIRCYSELKENISGIEEFMQEWEVT